MSKTYRVTDRFVTPPENAGQIVEVSYSVADDAQVIVERRFDRSDRATTYYAYRMPRAAEFDPANGSPKLGRSLGQCSVAE